MKSKFWAKYAPIERGAVPTVALATFIAIVTLACLLPKDSTAANLGAQQASRLSQIQAHDGVTQ